MNINKFQVGAILDSNKAFDIYHEATGKVPPPMPAGKNTYRIPFAIQDGKTERAALLVNQTGFAQTDAERAAGDEASGLSVFVALDAPTVEQGHATLLDWSDEILWPKKKEVLARAASAKGGRVKSEKKSKAARRNGKKGGRPKA